VEAKAYLSAHICRRWRVVLYDDLNSGETLHEAVLNLHSNVSVGSGLAVAYVQSVCRPGHRCCLLGHYDERQQEHGHELEAIPRYHQKFQLVAIPGWVPSFFIIRVGSRLIDFPPARPALFIILVVFRIARSKPKISIIFMYISVYPLRLDKMIDELTTPRFVRSVYKLNMFKRTL
jgi:hypothetical protein